MSVRVGTGAGNVDITSPMATSAVAAAEVKKVMLGTGSANSLVWQRKKTFSDGFDYGSNQIISTSLWTQQFTAPYSIWSISGNAAIQNQATDGNHSARAVFNDNCSTDLQYSKGVIVNIGNSARQTWVAIHSNADMTTYVGVQWNGSSLTLFTTLNGVATSRATASKAQVVGDILEARSTEGVDGVITYGIYINGTLYNSWRDASNVTSRGLGYRKVGFGMNRNHSFFVSTISSQFGYWEGGDL